MEVGVQAQVGAVSNSRIQVEKTLSNIQAKPGDSDRVKETTREIHQADKQLDVKRIQQDQVSEALQQKNEDTPRGSFLDILA